MRAFMNQAVQPALHSPLPKPEHLIEEFKNVAAESRFVMARYMQGMAIYLGFSALAFREALDPKSSHRSSVMIITAVTLINACAGYAAPQFRSMAYHALDRQAALAEALSLRNRITWFGATTAALSWRCCRKRCLLQIC
jgi:hypothetical protein